MENRVTVARKVLAATSALAIAVIGITVASPVASASTTQDQSALDQVLASSGSPVGLSACAVSAVQIAIQATIAHARGECIRLAPAPIGAMAFRYTGGYCR